MLREAQRRLRILPPLSTGYSAPKAEVSLKNMLQSHSSGFVWEWVKQHEAESSESLIKELTPFAKECGEV